MCSELLSDMNIKIIKIPVGALDTNCYIIDSDELSKVLIIDSGGDFLKIKEKISSLKKEVCAILLTHCHFDHMGACGDFSRENVPVFASRIDEKLINSPDNLGGYFGTKVEPFKLSGYLTEGKMNFCGYETEVINTPGHTAGSVSIKMGNNIFTGDTLFSESYGRTDFPTGSTKDLVESAKKLFSIEENCHLYPGHGENSTLFKEKTSNPINIYIKR